MEYETRVDLRSIELRGLAVLPHLADDVGGLVGGFIIGCPRILTGIVMGPARVEVERREQPPGDTVSGWEDAVELSCRAVAEVALAAGPWDESPSVELAINPPGAGWFRLRVHARNRDLEYDLVASEPLEEYLLVSWPAEPAAPTVLAAGSALAHWYVTTQTQAAATTPVCVSAAKVEAPSRLEAPTVPPAGTGFSQECVIGQPGGGHPSPARPGAIARSAGFSESPADAALRAQAEANLLRRAGGRPG